MSNTTTSDADVPEVTMSNTKKDLLEAYQVAKAALDKQRESLLKAEEARALAEEQAALATADAQTQEDPVRRLHELRTDVGRTFSELAEKLEDEIETYERVKTAALVKQEELRQLYDIEAAAADLAALIEAQAASKEQFETDMARRKEQLEDELAGKKTEIEADIAVTRADWQEEKTRYQAQTDDEHTETEKARKRDEEEYAYALEREREQRHDTLKDELATLEKEILSKREAFEREAIAKDTALQLREDTVTESEEELSRLRTKVEAFPAELAAAIQSTADETTARLNSVFESSEALIKAQFAGEKNVLLSKIESLEAQTTAQRAQLEELAVKQDNAYEKVQDIANRAVDAARREIVTVPVRQIDDEGR
ncbi:MAG: hypothetical protein KAI66_22450 [Lentisphaeria bacterium]|nr:hypothetical protein [Lentisphaeria bacterium]